LAKFTHPSGIPADSKKRAEAILWDLHLRGPVVDKSGRASQAFTERLAKVGWSMSTNSVNRIVNGLGDRGGRHGDLYPYNYIAREVNGKRTLSIKLIVDPDKVPFPPNPFNVGPAFHPVPSGRSKPKSEPAAEEGETFARQQQFVAARHLEELTPPPTAPPVVVEEEPVEEPVAEELVEPELAMGELEPYRSEAEVRTNGAGSEPDEFELVDLPEDLLTEVEDDRPRSAMNMVSAAISLLSDAMAAHAGEQVNLAADMLDRHIDARLGEYRVLQERLERSEGKLRHTVAQYERVVEIARTQRKQLIALQRELARLRPKATTSA
jgi:hypothetical protein